MARLFHKRCPTTTSIAQDIDFDSTVSQEVLVKVTEQGMFSCRTVAQLVVEVTDASILTVLATTVAVTDASNIQMQV